MAVGMFFTLAFLPVGLIVAFVVCCDWTVSWRWRALVIGAIGLGFALITRLWLGRHPSQSPGYRLVELAPPCPIL